VQVGYGWRHNVSPDFGSVKTDGSRFAAIHGNANREPRRSDRLPHLMILILSDDAVAAALLGALVETLGYSVRFARPPEKAEQSIRRVRPKVCLLDCDEPAACSDEVLGRAAMRGISVVIFGTSQALEHVRALAAQHSIDTLLVPPQPAVLDETIKRALVRAG
jgi:CheY-like chemotaxis protein